MNLYYATIVRRFWAFVIDYLILMMLEFAINVVFIPILSNTPDIFQIIYLILIVVVVMFYPPLCEMLFGGYTIGKKILKIRVVRSDGSPVSPVHSLQRYLILVLEFVFTFGVGALVSALVTRRRQRLGDLVADTVVVRTLPVEDIDYVEFSHISEASSQEDLTRWNSIDYLTTSPNTSPLELAKQYRALECDIATARTRKSPEILIDYLQRLLSAVHLAMFRRRSFTLLDTIAFTFRSIPKAVYSARYAILLSLLITICSYGIGFYSQYSNTGFFEQMMGESYAQMTLENIKNGKPMDVYASYDQWEMFIGIFFNNFFVSLKTYMVGVFSLFGPLVILLANFVSFSAFDAFFIQYGYATEVLVTPNEHGMLELSTIIINGGAGILLGTGWLFPGRLTRLQALARSARHSLLVFLSTVPVIFVAAFIESFITRYTEWPMFLKLSIIIISAIFILAYYVVLPILSKRH